MAALMLLSAAPDVLRIPGAVEVFRHLMAGSYIAYRTRPSRADSHARRIHSEGTAAGRIGLGA